MSGRWLTSSMKHTLYSSIVEKHTGKKVKGKLEYESRRSSN
jgi:hypothetical protein